MIKKIFVATVVGITMLATMAVAQIAPPVTYVWTAPTEGSPVAEYVVEVDDGTGWVEMGRTVTTTYTFVAFEYLTTYIVRVAGIDAALRQGPYSLPSDPYTPDLGVPGAPGKPVITP